MLRRTTSAAAAALVVGLLSLPASPAQAETVLTVPEAPSGDTVVTVATDPATAPYVRVRLVLKDHAWVPPSSASVIGGDPVPNTGEPINVTVPTWGIGEGTIARFQALGCQTAEVASCSATLASADHAITQTAASSATITKPDGVLLLAHEQLTARADNDGGGRMLAISEGRRSELPNGVATDVSDVLTGTEGYNDVEVRRCSAVTEDSSYCEAADAAKNVTWFRTIEFSPSLERPDPTDWSNTMPFTMNSTWWTGAQRVGARGWWEGLDFDQTWQIQTEAGQVLAGPVHAVPADTYDSWVTVDPGNHAPSGIPDGTYRLVFKTTVHKGDLSMSGESEVPIEVVNRPAADPLPRIYKAERVVRPYEWVMARFAVGGFPDPREQTRFILRNSAGRDVRHQSMTHRCDRDIDLSCPRGAIYNHEVHPYGDNNHLLQPGIYQARMVMPNSWGRLITVPLGSVYIQELRMVSKTVAIKPKAALLRRQSAVGRCSRTWSPGPSGKPGSIWMVAGARCGGTADVVRQTFAVPVPSWQSNNFDSIFSIDVAADLAPRGGRGTIRQHCLLPTQRSWRDRGLVSSGGARTVCRAFDISDFPVRRPYTAFRLRAANGAALEVKTIRANYRYLIWHTPR
ncbi:hypothetical protein [Nocardioides speluncae]|uniref:hypothetical protein n=1 Tax=Nocardioides speluncae TaxID=2670337 RepID=UPI0012B168D7|nr:hypothetical protein [Nocardioides speluncae]